MKNRPFYFRILSMALLLLNSVFCFAENASGKVATASVFDNLGMIMVGFALAFAFGVVLYLFRVFNLLIHLEDEKLMKERGMSLATEGVKVATIPLWKKLYDWSTQAVPVEKEKDILLDHNYDGIRELDNSLPPWWLAMFYISIVVGIGYFSYYHILEKGPSSSEEYAMEMAVAEKRQRLRLAMQANSVNENSVKVLTSNDALAAGQKIFINNCAACHGQKGEGGVGPNLTDNYWIHDGDIKGIFKTIKYGVPEKGMIAWKSQLAPSSIHEVASFITTLAGTNPPNGKAPEGDLQESKSEETSEEESSSI